jgi:hypothetical protein
MSTAVTTEPTTMPVPFASPAVHRITVDEYERIIEAGALEDPGRVELIDGYMVDKMGKNGSTRPCSVSCGPRRTIGCAYSTSSKRSTS